MTHEALTVRMAEGADVPTMVAMLEERRRHYEVYEPIFWKKAANSVQLSEFYFTHLLTQPTHWLLVAERNGDIEGFLIAFDTPAPPVVDPGGPTFTIDDYCVRHADLWEEVGGKLIDEVLTLARAEGWRQIVVVCPHKDRNKSDFLANRELSLTTEWWTLTV